MQIIRQFLIRPYLYIFIALIGISLKFYHLDYKLFWFDEICTIQHTSGIPDREYPALIPINEIKNISFYNDLYHLKKQDYKIGPQLKGLLTSTQLNPLHYPFLMIWYRIVGDNPVHFRLFSVFIFIITLPFLFLLSQRFFNSTLTGWIAVSLYAVSPFIHLFAQEARYYILWSFILVVLHYLFLQVIRINNIKWWSAYTLVASLSLYASPVSIIIIFGHLVFVVITRKDLIKRYSISMLVVFLVYLPWALSLFFKLDEITSVLSWQSNNKYNVAFWLPFLGQCLYLVSIFSFKLDYLTAFDQKSFNIPPEAGSAFIFNTIVLVIIIWSIVFLFRKTKKEICYFLLLIIIPGFLFFYLNDLLRGAMTSWWWRYLIFIAPGVILVMTNFLYKKIENGKFLYFVCYLTLALIGISSIVSIAEARHWHIGNKMNVYIENARLISKAEKPILITDFANNRSMVDFMVVMQDCNSYNIDILRAAPGIDSVENRIDLKEYSDVYVIYASDELIGNLKSQFDGKMEKLNVEGISSMWKINIEKQQ
jgi:uncharacterized membrane protein